MTFLLGEIQCLLHTWPALSPVWPASGWTIVSSHISFDSQRLCVFLDFLLSLYLGEKSICLTTLNLVLLSFMLFFSISFLKPLCVVPPCQGYSFNIPFAFPIYLFRLDG